jgi:hypothetical protein
MVENNDSIVEDWWDEWQIELVKDKSKSWELRTFKNVPGFWTIANGHKLLVRLSDQTELPEGATIDENAWNHEHCELCHETIAEYENYQHDGYFDGEKWICITCFKKYIEPGK